MRGQEEDGGWGLGVPQQQSTEPRDVSAAMRFIRLHKNIYVCVS